MSDALLMAPDAPGAVPPARPKLLVEGVSKWFRTPRAEVHALHDVSLSVAEGEFVCLVGPSGCGKSTLLDIVAGLTRPDAGRVLADGQLVEGPGRQRLVMFQESALFPWLDALGNVMFGLKLRPDLTNARRREIARRHLELVGLENFARAHVHELSGGMKQRVALARALAPDPQVLLMDEPFSALDALTRDQLCDDLQRIWAESGKTILFVTHNVREAVCLADRVVLLAPRPGRIAEVFDIRLPRPRDMNGVELSEHAARIAAALKGTLCRAGAARPR
jgi:NitT/TauT family transport system ATP-binding protein